MLQHFFVEECPRSVVLRDPQMEEIVQLYQRARALREVGVSSFSPDSLPIALGDAFVVISGEEQRVDREISERNLKEAGQNRE